MVSALTNFDAPSTEVTGSGRSHHTARRKLRKRLEEEGVPAAEVMRLVEDLRRAQGREPVTQSTKRRPKGYRGKSGGPRLRAELRERDGDWCYHCGHRLAVGQETIDHLLARLYGGGNDRKNLVLACFWCNHLKGDQPVDVFQADPRLHERRKNAIRCRLRELAPSLTTERTTP